MKKQELIDEILKCSSYYDPYPEVLETKSQEELLVILYEAVNCPVDEEIFDEE